MFWQEGLNNSTKLIGSLARMELRFGSRSFRALIDAQLVLSTDPGYWYTVVIHFDPVYVIPQSVSPSLSDELGL